MGKQTRKQKREEETKRFSEGIGEMKGQTEEKNGTSGNVEPKKKYKRFGLFEDKTPENLHCRKCKALMENGVCPQCGFRSYVPMDEKKRQKIRLILTCVFCTVFVVLFVWLQIK